VNTNLADEPLICKVVPSTTTGTGYHHFIISRKAKSIPVST